LIEHKLYNFYVIEGKSYNSSGLRASFFNNAGTYIAHESRFVFVLMNKIFGISDMLKPQKLYFQSVVWIIIFILLKSDERFC